jgi:adenylate kinase family enzyme
MKHAATGLDRVLVVGTTGCGKSTLAARLAQLLGSRFVDLDDLNWRPGWRQAPLRELRAQVAAAAAAERWTMAGNYRTVRDLTLARCQTVIFLDYPLPVVFTRLVGRTFRRAVRREVICNGNRENLLEHFFSRDSLLLWCLRTHRRRGREYRALTARPEPPHLRVLRFTTPWQTARWLARLAAEGVAPPAAIP